MLDRRDGLDERLPETQLRRVLVAPGDDMLLPRRIDRAILQERLRKRELNPRLKLGSKLASGFVVDVRDASHDMLHVPPPHGTRCLTPVDEPVVDTDASIAEEEIRRRRDIARAPERRRKLGNEGTARLGHARDLDLGCETHNRQLGLFSTARRTASFSVRRRVGAGVTCADAAVAPKTAVMIAPRRSDSKGMSGTHCCFLHGPYRSAALVERGLQPRIAGGFGPRVAVPH